MGPPPRPPVAGEALLDDPVLGQARRRQLGDDPPVAEHEHPVAQVREVLVLDARDDHGAAGLGQRRGCGEDLLLRADVDALRGLVQEEDLWPRREPLREQRLLLVAAAQLREHARWPWRDDVEVAHLPRHLAPLAPVVEDAATEVGRQGR